MSVKKPVHTCVCVCACGWREGGMVHSSVFLAPRHSESTCLNSMWSPGPAHCSQTLPLVFAMLAAEWKTPACLSTCCLISRHTLTACKHVLQREFSGKTVVKKPNITRLIYFYISGDLQWLTC